MKNKILSLSLLYISVLFNAQEKSNVEHHTISTIHEKDILEEGTHIKVALKNEIRGGKMKVGDQVEFYLYEPIIFKNKVLVNKGARILGTISEARASGVLGRKGKLAFNIDYLYLESGQVVKLTGQNAKNLKGSGAIVAATSILITPLGLLIPGKGAKFEAGTIFDAYIAQTTEIR